MVGEPEIRLDYEKRQIQAHVGEEQIGQITVLPIRFDWGRGIIVPMAGIVAVGTHQDYRRRGVAGRMMRRAVEYSREEEYCVGGVSTGYRNVARRLYTRAGYVYLFDVDEYDKPVGRPEPAPVPDGVEIRPYAAGDDEGIIALWKRSYLAKDFFGGSEASTTKWITERTELLSSDPRSVWVALRDGSVSGWAEYYYFWFNREHCELLVDESDDAAGVARAVLTRLERSVSDAGLARFTFHASRYQPRVANSLLDVGCCRKDGFVFNLAIFDLSDLLRRLQPLYADRLQSSDLDSWPSILRVGMGEQAAEIELPGGDAGKRVEVSGPYETVVRVLCGCSSAWEEYLCSRLRITGDLGEDGSRVMDVLLGQYPWFNPQRDRW